MNISRNVATIRRTSCISFKYMNTDDLVSHRGLKVNIVFL